MKQFYLSEITTKDNLVHQGLYVEPARKNKKAILWVHGLTGRFYGDQLLMNLFADVCEQHGWGFASFNNRGHDVITPITKLDQTSAKGKTNVNGGNYFQPYNPFGGYKESGIGREHGKYGFHELCQTRIVSLKK